MDHLNHAERYVMTGRITFFAENLEFVFEMIRNHESGICRPMTKTDQ